MLTKRTNILFDEAMWEMLSKRSKAEKVSIGQLVRNAIKTSYTASDRDEIRKAHEEILRIRTVSKGKTDYKALINYGRKY